VHLGQDRASAVLCGGAPPGDGQDMAQARVLPVPQLGERGALLPLPREPPGGELPARVGALEAQPTTGDEDHARRELGRVVAEVGERVVQLGRAGVAG
jgi:hypothetical protein